MLRKGGRAEWFRWIVSEKTCYRQVSSELLDKLSRWMPNLHPPPNLDPHGISMRVSVLLFVLLTTCAASSQSGTEAKLPTFGDYPVHENWSGPAAAVKFRTRTDRMYRTQFREAAKLAPNFAGHYRVATWGCGTQCLEAGLVDLLSGQLYSLPYRGKKWEKWSFCESVWGGDWEGAAQTRVDSRLLITNCANAYGPGDFGPQTGTYARTSYFVFENGRFRKIAEHIGQERVN